MARVPPRLRLAGGQSHAHACALCPTAAALAPNAARVARQAHRVGAQAAARGSRGTPIARVLAVRVLAARALRLVTLRVRRQVWRLFPASSSNLLNISSFGF